MNRLHWGIVAAVPIAVGIAAGIFAVVLLISPGCACGGPPPADPSTVARVMASVPPALVDGVPGAVGIFCWDTVCGSDEGLSRAPLVSSAKRVTFAWKTTRVLGGKISEPGDKWQTLTVSSAGSLGDSDGATYIEINAQYAQNRSAIYIWRLK